MKAPKPIDLPPAVARAFVKDMRAFFAEEDKHKQTRRDRSPPASRAQGASGTAREEAAAVGREKDVSRNEGYRVTLSSIPNEWHLLRYEPNLLSPTMKRSSKATRWAEIAWSSPRRHTASSGIADVNKRHFEGRPHCRYRQIGTGEFLRAAGGDLQTIARHRGQYRRSPLSIRHDLDRRRWDDRSVRACGWAELSACRGYQFLIPPPPFESSRFSLHWSRPKAASFGRSLFGPVRRSYGLALLRLLAVPQDWPIVGFDYERRHHAEHDQDPSDQTSIPKESVDHEPLLNPPGWVRFYRQHLAYWTQKRPQLGGSWGRSPSGRNGAAGHRRLP